MLKALRKSVRVHQGPTEVPRWHGRNAYPTMKASWKLIHHQECPVEAHESTVGVHKSNMKIHESP